MKADTATQTGVREFRFPLRERDTSSRLVSVKMFKGNMYVGIHEYFGKSASEPAIPTKKGIKLNVDEWSWLKCLVQHVDDAVKTLTCS